MPLDMTKFRRLTKSDIEDLLNSYRVSKFYTDSPLYKFLRSLREELRKKEEDILCYVYEPDFFSDETWDSYYFIENGEYHREDAPASINIARGSHKTESNYWYKHGKLHRLDGPACNSADDNEYLWFINGEEMKCSNPVLYGYLLGCPAEELPKYMDEPIAKLRMKNGGAPIDLKQVLS